MVSLAIALLAAVGVPFFWAAHATWLVGQPPIGLAVTAVNWLCAVFLFGVRKRQVRSAVMGWCVSALAIAAVWMASAQDRLSDERMLPMTVAVVVHTILCGLVFVALMSKAGKASYPSPEDDLLAAELASRRTPATSAPTSAKRTLIAGFVALTVLVTCGYWFGLRGPCE